MRYLFCVFFTFYSYNSLLLCQKLERRASFEAKILWPTKANSGAKITAITKNSPLEKAGLKESDVILKVNNRTVLTQEDWSAILYGIRSKSNTLIQFKRNHKLYTKTLVLNPIEKEKNRNVDTFYEYLVNNSGQKQRVIITKPKIQGKQPAIILIQGLSCSTVEKYSERSNNWVKLIQGLVEKSNMVLLRIEKPGVGDSEGDCGKTDFETELSGYEAAVNYLKSKPYVDSSKIVVYGNSLGSAIAPYLATKYNLAGVISDGTFLKSWYEHMLEIERRILVIEGKKEEEIFNLMNTIYIPLYYKMLIEKQSFFEILQKNPTYKKSHRQGLYHMYGRSMEYYHQMQDFNFAKSWENLNVPVRIRWGTNDWIMSEVDNDMLIQLFKKNSLKDYELYKYPNLDHWSTIHPNYEASFNFKPGKWEEKISQQIIDWAWEIVDKN